MPKGYLISAHRKPADPVKGAAYRELAKPAMEAHGGKYLASRNVPSSSNSRPSRPPSRPTKATATRPR
ncbi:MAG: DUF1330 domain-containing protein [Rhodospirillaceae bacterium]